MEDTFGLSVVITECLYYQHPVVLDSFTNTPHAKRINATWFALTPDRGCCLLSPHSSLLPPQAFQSVLVMAENRDKYPAFCIPMVVIPATISNNIPGTDFTVGADSALNEITQVRSSSVGSAAHSSSLRGLGVRTRLGVQSFCVRASSHAGGKAKVVATLT